MLRTLRANNPSPLTLDGTCTYLVGREEVLVIDPGPAGEGRVGEIVAAVGDGRVVGVVVTHHHADHAGVAPGLAERTGAALVVGRDSPLVDAGGGAGAAAIRRVRTGDWLESDGGRLIVLETPGHTRGHLALEWEGAGGGVTGGPAGGVATLQASPGAPIRSSTRGDASADPSAGARETVSGPAIFVGDLLLGQGDTALVAAPEGDVAAYLASLDLLEARRPGILYPGHGPPLRDPAEAIARFRAHRLERVEQVRAALARHPAARADELVELIYGEELPAPLRDAAAASVEASRAYLAGGA